MTAPPTTKGKAAGEVMTPTTADSKASIAIVPTCGEARKALDTLKAEFAMKGHTVYELADGGFLVSRWGLSRACPDLHALMQFARQLGVRT